MTTEEALEKARQYIDANQVKDAVTILEYLKLTNETNADVWMLLATVRSEPQERLDALTTVLDLRPGDKQALEMLRALKVASPTPAVSPKEPDPPTPDFDPFKGFAPARFTEPSAREANLAANTNQVAYTSRVEPNKSPYAPLPVLSSERTQNSTMYTSKGWLLLAGGAAALIGFFLPWSTAQVLGVGGGVSGLQLLISAVAGMIASVGGAVLGAGSGLGQLGGAVTGLSCIALIIELVILILLVYVPIAAFRIGKIGYEFSSSYELSDTWAAALARDARGTAVRGLIPGIILMIASLGFNVNLSGLGISLGNPGIGLILTLGGFGATILMSIVVVAAAEREMHRKDRKHPLS